MSVRQRVAHYRPRKHHIKKVLTKKVTIAKWELNAFGVTCLSIGVILGAYGVLSGMIPRILASSDISETWTFANAGDYVVSDANSIEVVDNAVRLKVRQYESDQDTVALLHFNEASGTAVTDSSSLSQAGQTNGSFGVGRLYNALQLNGQDQRAWIADSPGLSLGQQHTVEAWVKPEAAISANSHGVDQTILDKGDYKLYVDHHTGKLTYELAKTGSSWTQEAGNDIKGSWDLNGKMAVTSQVMVGSQLIVGLGNAAGDAEVWRWDGDRWWQIGGDGLNDSWPDQMYETVPSLAANGTIVYAGLGVSAGDGEVWQCDLATNCASWTKIGGDAINNSWPVSAIEAVNAMLVVGGTLYVGLGDSANDARVYSWNGTTWSYIGGYTSVPAPYNAFPTGYERVYNLRHKDGRLYASFGNTAGDADVWMLNGTTWTQIGGDGLNSSWAAATYEMTYGLEWIGDRLYAGLGSSTGDAELWYWNGTTWTMFAGDGVGGSWPDGTYEVVYEVAGDSQNNIYVGLGSGQGDASVWHWNGSAWTQIGGLGTAVVGGFGTGYTGATSLLYRSGVLYVGLTDTNDGAELWRWQDDAWTRLGGGYVNKSWGFYGMQSVEQMTQVGAYLYAGTGQTTAGNAQVWRYDGQAWLMVGGQGINGSWAANTYEQVTSMASWQGQLYVGLGTTTNDAEVWRWNGSAWSRIGGIGVNGSWNTSYEMVPSLLGLGQYLYAGLGSSSGDAEVYRWDGSAWLKIGGDSLNSGWTTGFDKVTSMVVFEGKLHVGLGVTAGEAEVWSWNGSSWTKFAGDGLSGSWNTVYEEVQSMIVYNRQLYVGLGNTAGDAEVWRYDGGTSSWSQIGGDQLHGSWLDGQYELVRAMAVYNGQLYVGLGLSAGDGEVWRLDGQNWTQVGGSALNGGWTNVVEGVYALATYQGKLLAGTGISANADAAVWSWGDNTFVQAGTAGLSADWHHVAARYDGAVVALYLDGAEVGSKEVLQAVPDGDLALLIGSSYGSESRDLAGLVGHWQGAIDELRISSTARSSFMLTPYTTTAQTIRPVTAVRTTGVLNWDNLVVGLNLDGGQIAFRLSDDNGSTWKYWNGTAWVVSQSLTEANPGAVLTAQIEQLTPTSAGLLWQAVLYGDGSQRPQINSVELLATSDGVAPANPDTLQALEAEGSEAELTNDAWYRFGSPYFAWSGATDSGSGVGGYYVYFGVDATADPLTAGTWRQETYFSPQNLTTGQTYYLRLKATDRAGNVASGAWQAFSYRYDASPPHNPGVVSASPSGYTNVNHYTFVWPVNGEAAATDVGAGLAGYQYKTGASSGPLSNWSATVTGSSVTISEAAYQEGANTFQLRTVDLAGNVSTNAVSTNFYFAGEAPTSPTNLQVSPSTSTTNSFAFSWAPPELYSGQLSQMTYCYTVNTLPSADTCTFTGRNVTSLPADAYATQPGQNTLYVVARDETGNIAYGAYAQVHFTSNTQAPGMPLNQDISDVSVKSTRSWKVALAWEPPDQGKNDVANYQIYHSLDNVSFSRRATTSGIAFVDTGLTQERHYYKIRACDSTNNCGAFTAVLSLVPDGKYTEPAELLSQPELSSLTTKQVRIGWTTDRASDSKVAYGLKPGQYYPGEPSMPSQVTDHEVSLSNLTPGTTYFYKVKWTDEDGNTGASKEFQFTTLPAPSITDPKVKAVGLSTASIEYVAKGASSVKIYYGLNQGFGGVQELATSVNETKYVTVLDGLRDGTTYYYKIAAVDAEGDEYGGSTLTLTTVARPQIQNVTIEQVAEAAQPSVTVQWTTNTETSSIVSYYPVDDPGAARDVVTVALVAGEHKLRITDLRPQTAYALVAKGRDGYGNEAVSDVHRFTTSTDTRPAKISNVKVEGSKSQGGTSQTQLVVTWTTDEPATSQVEFGVGSGGGYGQKTQEDSNLTTNHLVVIPNLTPSEVYHLRVISKDAADNESKSADVGTITPKAPNDAFSLVLANLAEVFSFLNILK